MKDLIYEPTTGQVARALLTSGSYLIKDINSLLENKNWFKWKSGIEAPVYTNCRYLMGNPGATAVVVQSLVSSIKNNFPGTEMIIGIESAGIQWSSTVALDMGLSTAFVRKKQNVKKHGVDEGRYVGSPNIVKNTTAVIVDDLMASGESLEEAIQVLTGEKQIKVIGVQTIVNWNFSHMKERFRRLGVMVKALVSYPQILEEVVNQGIIDEETKNELLFFYQNPRHHKFDFGFLKNKIKKTGTEN